MNQSLPSKNFKRYFRDVVIENAFEKSSRNTILYEKNIKHREIEELVVSHPISNKYILRHTGSEEVLNNTFGHHHVVHLFNLF